MPNIKCKNCHGRGTIPLSGAYSETLTMLRRCREPVSGADMAKLMGTSNEAMCNRLRMLERYNLARGEKYGRKVLWQSI